MKKNKKFLLGVGVDDLTKKEVLEEIKKGFQKNKGFFQIFTINPEILLLAQKNKRFKRVLNKAKIATVDGIGVLLAGKILGKLFRERVTGVELLKSMVKMASDFGLKAGFIGGRGQIALKTAECLKKKHPNFDFFALEGFKDVKNPKKEEWKKILSIIGLNKPQMLFVAFGAPWQEFFIEDLKYILKNMVTRSRRHAEFISASGRILKQVQNDNKGVVDQSDWFLVAVGVGGTFDEISGQVKRVPRWLDRLGLKWLWRLLCQPWRWKRQLALIEFLWLVAKERLRRNADSRS